MKTKYTISNFKNFNAEGTTINLAPITILTGRNSSGKSSMVKSLVILDDFLDKVKQDWEKNFVFDLTNKCLDFSTSHLQLGSYDLALNRNASKNAPITFKYESVFAGETFVVSLSFNKNKKDILNNGWCERFTIENQNGEVVADCRFNSVRGFRYDKLNIAYIKRHIINIICYLTHSYLLYEEEDWRNSEGRSGIGFKVTEKWHKLLDPVINSLTVDEKHFYTNQILTGLDKGDPFGFISSIDFNHDPEESQFGHLLKSFGNNIIFFTELNDLQGLNKIETIEVLRKKANYIHDSNIINKTEQIIRDFERSDFDTFLSYYESKENEYFSKLNKNNNGYIEYSDWRATNRPSVKPYLKTLLIKDIDYVVPKGYYEKLKTSSGKTIDLGPCRNEIGEIVYSHYYTQEETIKKQKELSEKWRNAPLNFDTINRVLLALFNKLPDFNIENVYSYESLAKLFHFFDYVDVFIASLVIPDTAGSLKYVPAEGVNVKRLYATNDMESSISRALVEYNQLAMYNEGMGGFMNKWLQKLEIAHSIEFIRTDEGSGFVIFLNKTTSKKDRFLLADEGYGITQLVYTLIQIEIAIVKRDFYKDKNEFTHAYYDYVKKAYPYTICVEEPENHLHPRFQSLLADMFFEAYDICNIHFIVETHSEYIIREAQVQVARAKYKDSEILKQNNPIRVFYIPKGGSPYDMEFRPNGKFENEFGTGFFDEADNKSLDLFELEE